MSLLISQLFTRSQLGWSFASCTFSRDFYSFVKGASLILLPNTVVSPPSLPAVRNHSRMSYYVHSSTKSTLSLARYMFTLFCRLSIVVVRCCWGVSY